MIMKILTSIVNFLIELGEYRYEVMKTHGYKTWY